MKEGNEVEIYYRWCEVDKRHEYSVVCNERHDRGYCVNGWIYWIWYKMGVAFKKRKDFRLLPFANTWDKKSKLIKEYKTVNGSTDRVVTAIKNHLKKIKQN